MRPLSYILRLVASDFLAYGKHQTAERSHFICTALYGAYRYGQATIAEHSVASRFLLDMGMVSGRPFPAYFYTRPDEETQATRYCWLMFAAKVAAEEEALLRKLKKAEYN